MKRALFILVLCWSQLFSQVTPADLRCLQVMPNGDVKLTWVPPADPSNSFFAYKVYASNTPGGPFAFFGPLLTSISTTTYVLSTTVTIAQSMYFYVATLSGSGGANVVTSQTLQTMHLNIYSTGGAVDLKIQYNDIHDPKLPTSSPTFTINKEYPAGSVNPLAVLAGLNYADTISVCHADITYQIALTDNSGCFSSSNAIHGNYTDTYRPGGPNGPFVDSISVLPDGRTVIAWEVPRDKDIVKYQIYAHDSPTAIIVRGDQVPGRLSTAYTYTNDAANSQEVALYVAAIDSCSEDAGVYNLSPITIFLKAKYNNCAYQTNLVWNKYRNLPGGILEYRVYYSSNGTTFSLIGNTTDTNYVHAGVAPETNVCYFVRVVNNPKTITASSNRACFFSTQITTSGFVYMRTATVESKSSVLLKMYLDTAKTCQGIDIYRADDGSHFNNIGFMPFTKQMPFYNYSDATAKPSSQSYVYKAVIRDECGNPRANSNAAKTVFLKVEDDQQNIFTKHLSWSSYEGFGGNVQRYTIYRVVNDVPTSSPVRTVNAGTNFFTDDIEEEATQGAKIEYLVQAAEGPGNTYGFFETSNSNSTPVYMEGNIYIPTAFAPNGHNKLWMPVTHFIDKNNYNVNVFNRWGKKVFETSRDDEGWNGENCIPDVYVYLIRYKDALGEYKEVKGTVLLLE